MIAGNIVEINKHWEERLSVNDSGAYKKTIDNFCTILENEYNGKILYNELANMVETDKKKPFETVDYDKIQREIEKKYGIYDVKKLNSAIRIVAENHKYHPVKEYLDNLKWDGISRVETCLEEYLGTREEEHDYNAMCLRLFLFGAIERALNPGAKFDYMLIINGAQGIGKSSFFKIMCGDNLSFYQENFNNFEKAFEYTNGKWIVEIAELNAFSKTDINFLKTYITTSSETYRIPYEPTPKQYLRQFVLFGTTNESNFIPDDPTGERRFVVIEAANDSRKKEIKKKIYSKESFYELQQVLAEVYCEYKDGRKFLEIPEEFREQVTMKNKEFKYDDGLTGMIEQYLSNKTECCVQEVFNRVIYPLGYIKYTKALGTRIQEIIIRIPGWKKYSKSKDHRKWFQDYGKQIAFERTMWNDK